MHENVRKDILWIIAKSTEYLASDTTDHQLSLRELSTHTVHNASIFQDEDSVSIAVLIYTLSKIALKKFKGIDVKHLLTHLRNCQDELLNNHIDAYRTGVEGIFSHLRTAVPNLRQYIEDVIVRARISKARHIHEHGISVTQTAHILGINTWELHQYLGRTRMGEAHYIMKGVPIETRLITARSIFHE